MTGQPLLDEMRTLLAPYSARPRDKTQDEDAHSTGPLLGSATRQDAMKMWPDDLACWRQPARLCSAPDDMASEQEIQWAWTGRGTTLTIV